MLVNSTINTYQNYTLVSHTQQKSNSKILSSEDSAKNTESMVLISDEAKVTQRTNAIDELIGESELKKLNEMYSSIGKMAPERNENGTLMIDGFKVQLALDKEMATLNGRPEPILGADYITNLIEQTKASVDENGLNLNYLQSALNYFIEG